MNTARGLAAGGVFTFLPGQVQAAEAENKTVENPFSNCPDFKFNKKGKFKVMQLTDTHYVGTGSFPDSPKKAAVATPEIASAALANITNMLDTEKPDLVIHTGDVFYGEPAKENMAAILSPMAKRKIPFAVTLGNHDEEFGLSRQEVFDFIRTLPSNINTPSPEGIHGSSNNIITLSGDNGTPERVFYLFDSGRKFIEKPTCYDFIRHDQIEWYCRASDYFKKKNNGKSVPSMAFMHIALREYRDGLHDEIRILKGNNGERPGCSLYNSGLFATTVERDDIDTFVFGHDHDDDCAMWYKNKFLIYGRYSGYDSTYNNLKPAGVRLFEFTQGEKGYRSWIRLYNQQVIQDLQYPKDFYSDRIK